MIWDGALYVDASLPFGFRLAPKIFNTLADAQEWILSERERVSRVFHYLDNFLVIGMLSSSQCEQQLRILLDSISQWLLRNWRAQLVLIFLGNEMDTHNWPYVYLRRSCVNSRVWLQFGWTGSGTLRASQEVANACKVVCPGWLFLRWMFELLKGMSKKQYYIWLNCSFCSDSTWWHLFLESWNGMAMMGSLEWHPDIHLFSDASGSFGCGAWWGQSWLQVAWIGSMY